MKHLLEWQGCGKYSQKTETHFVTKAFFTYQLCFLISLNMNTLEGIGGNEKPRAGVNIALPKPQVTQPS